MADKCIATLVLGDYRPAEYAISSFGYVSEKHGWDIEIIDDTHFDFSLPSRPKDEPLFEKYQCFYLLEEYDRVLLLDSDILLTPDFPDVFDIVDEDEIGVVYEDKGSRKKDRRKRIQQIKDKTNDSRLNAWNSGYLNSGMYVLGKQHKEIMDNFDPDSDMVQAYWIEQSTLNYLFARSRFPVVDLGYKFNHMTIFSEDGTSRFDSYAIHYAGPNSFPGHEGLNTGEAIREDYNYLYR